MGRVNVEELLEEAGVKPSEIGYAQVSFRYRKAAPFLWIVRVMPASPYDSAVPVFTSEEESKADAVCKEINSLLRTLRRLKEPRRG